MLLDSNIIISAAKPGGEALAGFLAAPDACISVITRIESLGYHLLSSGEEREISLCLTDLPELALDDLIADRAIVLRQQKKLGLADSIIAATALLYDLPLVTRNEDDFKHIAGLHLINPFNAI